MTKRIPFALTALLLGLTLAPLAQAASAVRHSSFVYDPASGLLTKEIIEPGNPQLCLVTEYSYDAYGNKTSVTTRNCNGTTGEAAAPAAGSDGVIAPRTTSSLYDAQGRFAVSTTNALGHTETRTFNGDFGTVASLTGPNGLTTTWGYDTFGRKALETRADNTQTLTSYLQPCDQANGDLTLAKYCVASISSGEGRYHRTFYDVLNRKLATTQIDFTNTLWVDHGRVDYNNLGQVTKSYLPYVRGSFASAQFSTASYDAIGRVQFETAPNGAVTSKQYSGLTTTDTNALGQTKVTVKNITAQTVSITDAQAGVISYSYDPFGNLINTIDDKGNVTTLTYDTRGRKIQMNDPDMGIWTYAYNALGQLIRQRDAKAQTVTMVYDLLGRMTTRNEPDLISNWVYDTAAKGIGKLTSSSSNNGYSRTHSYDTLGRLIQTSTVIDNAAAPYITKTSYDSVGRVLTQTYPTGFATKNIYNAIGYLTSVVNAAAPTTVYWTANAMDAMGHLTQQTYGNGLVTQQVFDPATGRLTNQYAGAGNAVQSMSYTYDSLGNLKIRTDANSSLTETFAYDTLNRVNTATATSGAVNSINNYIYDSIGNITQKSDAGIYTYNPSGAGSVRPHAVTSISGMISNSVSAPPVYSYDNNGNMTSGAGRTITWSSFNIPTAITDVIAGVTNTTSFLYNPEHERTKEVQADSSIVITLSPRYDTGLHFEKRYLTNPTTKVATGAVEYEHYLYAGGMMFGKYITTTTTNGVTIATTAMEYYSKDHLGSIVAITDGAGAVQQRLSYDVWGKRRQPNGVADPLGLLANNDMYHGFTGHEMLDAVGLIHMNGRLYDPMMGRFISADFLIQAPGNLQSYNRYTYGWNNPLFGTDPSGQSWLGDRWHAATGTSWSSSRDNVVKPIVIAVVSYYTGGLVSSWAMGGMVSAAGGAMAITSAEFVTATIVSGAIGGAAAGFASGFLASGGNVNAGLRGAEVGAIQGGFGSAANLSNDWVVKASLRGVGAGEAAKVLGGSFNSAFKYAFISSSVHSAADAYSSSHIQNGEGYQYTDDPAKGNATYKNTSPSGKDVICAECPNVGPGVPFEAANPDKAVGMPVLESVGENSKFMLMVSKIPSINAGAVFHDSYTHGWDQYGFLGSAGVTLTAVPSVLVFAADYRKRQMYDQVRR